MARDNEWNGISAQSPSNGSRYGGPAQGVGKLGVSHGLSCRDFSSGFAHFPHKRTGPVQVNRDVPEVLKLALEMLAHSLDDLDDR
jgi:hypothetical protein